MCKIETHILTSNNRFRIWLHFGPSADACNFLPLLFPLVANFYRIKLSVSSEQCTEEVEWFDSCGNYGHSLFDNFSVGFNESRPKLTFTHGHNVEGFLIPINVEDQAGRKNFLLAFEGVLYNFLPAYGGGTLFPKFKTFSSVADPGFPVGRGRGPRRWGMDSRGSYVLKILYVKTKESGPLGGACARHAP